MQSIHYFFIDRKIVKYTQELFSPWINTFLTFSLETFKIQNWNPLSPSIIELSTKEMKKKPNPSFQLLPTHNELKKNW